MYISENTFREIRQNNNIVDVVSRYIRLKKSGNIYLGLSPFKKESEPSFIVDETKQAWHDLASGKSGDCIKFMADYHKIPIDKALTMLSGGESIKIISDEKTEYETIKESVYQIYEEAARFYQKNLDSSAGKEYLKSRNISDDTIKTWRIGMSPDCWGNKGSLYHHLTMLGYDKEILVKSGLFKENKNGGVFDMYRNRVMFPIIDTNNRVVGFGGRILTSPDVKDTEQGPKYMNSPGSVIFDKSNTLFGLNRKIDTGAKDIILCEGYMDVISLHQAGFTGAVASLGTALTERHCEIIKRNAENVYLTYDADAPGIKASIKAMYGLKKQGLGVKVISTNPFKDPDELIKKAGKDIFQKRIDSAKEVFSWFVDTAEKGINNVDVKRKEVTKADTNSENKKKFMSVETAEQVVDCIKTGYDLTVPEEKEKYKELISAVFIRVQPDISDKDFRCKEEISKQEFIRIFGGTIQEKNKPERLDEKLKNHENTQVIKKKGVLYEQNKTFKIER